MVRITSFLLRVPVIKFRKGTTPSSPATAASGGSPAQQHVQAQQAAGMSSATISDIDLPPRYRRRPLSQEEIDCINGGGVV